MQHCTIHGIYMYFVSLSSIIYIHTCVMYTPPYLRCERAVKKCKHCVSMCWCVFRCVEVHAYMCVGVCVHLYMSVSACGVWVFSWWYAGRLSAIKHSISFFFYNTTKNPRVGVMIWHIISIIIIFIFFILFSHFYTILWLRHYGEMGPLSIRVTRSRIDQLTYFLTLP